MSRVFLSHAGSDDSIASEIRNWLVEAGHEVFLDHDLNDGVVLGEEWELRLHERLRWADAIVCVVSPAYVSSTWCSAEVGAARSRGTRILPVSAEPGQLHPLLSFVHHTDLSQAPETARRRLEEALRRIDVGGGASGWMDGRSPFPGLRAFDTHMHLAFFGRSTDVTGLVGLLRSPAQRSENAVLLVVGPSGCGKSSLVRAGLLPVMAEEPGWWVLSPILPGTDPVAALTGEIARSARQMGLEWTVAQVRRRLAVDGLNEVAEELMLAATGGRGQRLLMVIDQFDELLTLTNAEQRARFADLLLPALGNAIQVVGTLRPEFLEGLLLDPGLGGLPTHVVPLCPLRRSALHEVIAGPAKLARIHVDEELVARLVNDTDDGEALPLLAFTLAELAAGTSPEGGAAAELSAARYDELGGVRGALIRQADAALDEAVVAGGRSADEVLGGLLRLVSVDEQGRPTRRRIERADLPAVETAEQDAFVARRLLATDIHDGGVVIGVAHEAFLSAWPPLATVISDRTAALRARSALEPVAAEWEAAGRPAERLWERGQLAAVVAETGTRPVRSGLRTRGLATSRVDMSPGAKDFLLASMRRDKVRRRAALTVLSGLLAVALMAGGVALLGQREAREQQRVATSRQLLAQAIVAQATDPQTALRLAIAAQNVHADEQSNAALVNILLSTSYAGTLTGHTAETGELTFDDTGRLMASGGLDGHVILWSVPDSGMPSRLGKPLTSDRELVGARALSRDGKLLATARADDSIVIWDISNPKAPRPLGQPLPAEFKQLARLSFSPDGHVLAVGGTFPATVALWDVSDAAGPRKLGVSFPVGQSLDLLAFEKDGRFLLTGADDEHFNYALRRWDLLTPDLHRELGKPLGYESPAQFNVSSGIFAGVDTTYDSQVDLWQLTDPASPKQRGSLSAYGENVDVLTFSLDGKELAVGAGVNADDVVTRWDISNPADPAELSTRPTGPEGSDSSSGASSGSNSAVSGEGARVSKLHAIAYTADPAVLLTIGGDDKQVVRWDFTDPARPAQLGPPIVGATGLSKSVSVFPNGRMVATGKAEGDIVLWDLVDPGSPRRSGTIDTGGHPVATVAQVDHDQLVLGLTDGAVQTWDLSHPRTPQRRGADLDSSTESSASVAVAPNGRLVAVSDPESVVLTDLRNPSRSGKISKPFFAGKEGNGPVASLSFSPNSGVLAVVVSAGFGGYTVLYDVHDPVKPRSLGPTLEPIDFGNSAVFSPKGHLLAFSGVSGVVLYDVAQAAHPKKAGTMLLDADSVAFSPDGRLVAVGTSDNGSVVLWDVADPAHPRRIGLPLTGFTDRVSAVAFSPDGRTLAAADGAGLVRMWDLTYRTEPRPLGSPLSLHGSVVSSTSFSPDSSILATGGADGMVALVDLGGLRELRSHARERACERVGSGLSRDEWHRYLPDLPYARTCP